MIVDESRDSKEEIFFPISRGKTFSHVYNYLKATLIMVTSDELLLGVNGESAIATAELEVLIH